MVRQLEEELRMRMRGPSVEMQQQMEVLYNENEHLTREIAILRDTIKVSGLFTFGRRKQRTPNFAFPNTLHENVINPSRSSSFAYRDATDIITISGRFCLVITCETNVILHFIKFTNEMNGMFNVS